MFIHNAPRGYQELFTISSHEGIIVIFRCVGFAWRYWKILSMPVHTFFIACANESLTTKKVSHFDILCFEVSKDMAFSGLEPGSQIRC